MKATLQSAGLKDVKHVKAIVKGSALQTMTQCYLWGTAEAWETVVAKKPEMKQAAGKGMEQVDKAWWELHEKGVGVDLKMLHCVGTKP